MNSKRDPGRLWCDRCRRRSTVVFRVGGSRLCPACRNGEPSTPEDQERAPLRSVRLAGVEEFK